MDLAKPNTKNLAAGIASAIIRKMRFCSVVLCLLAVTACSDTSPASPSPISREVVLAPGQTAAVAEAGITLRFDGVAGDSRCPADAICIQGGDALVRIAVIPTRGSPQAYALHTGDMRPVAHDDLEIALVELSPYPFSSKPILPDDYRARLRVTR
jgi:hypothetical protein